jgi:glycosyltransferase involved in cell wall biosynthesis
LDTYSALPDWDKQNNSSNAMHGHKKEPLVTAIVSTYNSEKYIRGCLQDLQAQTIAEQLEIIVVDSGSQQNEASIIKEFQEKYSNIRYIRTEARETIYSAWNRAAQEARGKYLTNANTDDRHRSDAFERMVHVLESNSDVALAYADAAVTEQENASFDHAPVNACFRWPEFDARRLFAVCYIGPQPMWRRSLH